MSCNTQKETIESTNPNDRLEQIARFVQNHLQEMAAQRPEDQNPDPDYRWQHTLRVSDYGRILAEAEGANVELVIAACLLHDVAHFDPGERRDHGRLGAEISRSYLLDLGYSSAETENICYSVASHVDVENEETLEATLVSEADNIDRFGAYRLILWCIENLDDYEKFIAKVEKRLQTLKYYRQQELMATKTGQTLLNEQLDRQIAFFEALIREKDLTVFPRM
jgi:putative nucleotidyltransferase with HDIG domain